MAKKAKELKTNYDDEFKVGTSRWKINRKFLEIDVKYNEKVLLVERILL